jgi:hypothetical protein
VSQTTPPPGCTLECLIKWFEDNQGNAADLKQIADHGERLYYQISSSVNPPEHANLIDALPSLIAEERVIHNLIRKHRAHWRKALGYHGQGLPPGEAADYQ